MFFACYNLGLDEYAVKRSIKRYEGRMLTSTTLPYFTHHLSFFIQVVVTIIVNSDKAVC